MGEVVEIRPQAGPQEAFLSSPADIVIYGGAAGGGKSFALTLDALRWGSMTPGFLGVVFRRESTQLVGLLEEADQLYPQAGGRWRGGKASDWRWEGGGRILYRHLQYEKDKLAHQGQQYAGIWFDELTHFTEGQFWYLSSRNRSTCGVRPFIRATCNPDPDSWAKKFIRWWLDDEGRFADPAKSGVVRYFVRDRGEVVWADTAEELERSHPHLTVDLVDEHGNYPRPQSATFILSKLDDNPALTRADPSYKAKLLGLQLVERQQLLEGDWKIAPAAGLYFRREMFDVIDTLPAKVKRRVRGWDFAASKITEKTPDPDFTAGVKIAELVTGEYVIEDVIVFRGSPGQVEAVLRKTAEQDGRQVVVAMWQDAAAAGKSDASHKVGLLRGFRTRVVPASNNKIHYAGPLSSQCEAGRVYLMRGEWNDRFLSEAESFPEGAHDDIVDAASRAFLELTSRLSGWIDSMKAASDRAAAKG